MPVLKNALLATSGVSPLVGRTVLIAHHDCIAIYALQRAFAAAGALVCGIAVSGYLAERAAAADRPDLVVIEDDLAEQSGSEACWEIRKHTSCQILMLGRHASRLPSGVTVLEEPADAASIVRMAAGLLEAATQSAA